MEPTSQVDSSRPGRGTKGTPMLQHLLHRTGARAAIGAAAATSLLLVAGCGNTDTESAGKSGQSPTAAGTSDAPTADTSLGEGTWLLGITSAGGADGETSTTTYLGFDPSTGTTTTRTLPGVSAGSGSPRQAVLLVSGNRAWAIPDTGISPSEQRSGRLTVHSLTEQATKTLDLAELTGQSDVRPLGWAFDPAEPATLNVVDSRSRVWAVPVEGGRATRAGTLPQRGWIFTNGFDPTTGSPWVESIDSDATRPSGNGPDDTRPVIREGGTVLPAGDAALADLPASPCRVGAGFVEDGGTTWTFCADKATVSAYYLPKDAKEWVPYGKPSAAEAPVASGFPLLLPPAE